MYQIEIYENYSASDYYDAVILFPDKASEAVYYLLKHRLARALGRVFELHGFGLDDHYEDTIDDFFLYLYDHGEAQPFAVINTVREKQAFFGWIVGAYRHFLLNKAKEEMKRREIMEEAGREAGEESAFADDTLVRFMATAIAFADQELPPLKLFVFYRMLLTILDPKLAIPQEEMARAVGMHPVTYRVYVNRMKTKLLDNVAVLERGQSLPLDPTHLLMCNRLIHRFDALYETLMPYYEASIRMLSNASEISALREGLSRDGILMHEDVEYRYPHVVEARELYKRLKS